MLEIRNIDKHYQNKSLLQSINLTVREGETLCLLGSSGSGKSTLLRIVAGLEKPENGRIFWKGTDITEKPPHLRHFGLMFQDYALFPHMTVSDNVAFGIRMQGSKEDEIRQRVEEVLIMVDMLGFKDRNVTDLSGGEQQRVALARAVAPEPDLLMLDEPLGSLDRTLHELLLTELREVLQKLETPVIYVTHDQEEAFSIADRLAVLHDASIIQNGSPVEVYAIPATLWLAGFLGFQNQISGEVTGEDPLRVKTAVGVISFSPVESGKYQKGDSVVLVIKPDGANFGSCEGNDNCLQGMVADMVFSGDRYKIKIELSNGACFSFFAEDRYERGSIVRMRIIEDSILCYRKISEY